MISFDFGKNDSNLVNYANRLAARRQTDEQREAVFARYRQLYATNPYLARVMADKELDSIPEYWDDDVQPRLPLNPTSSMIMRIEPRMGGAFVYFRSNPSKPYFYPVAGTTAATAKRIESLILSPDVEKHFTQFWK